VGKGVAEPANDVISVGKIAVGKWGAEGLFPY